jgi:hypothetical protein
MMNNHFRPCDVDLIPIFRQVRVWDDVTERKVI